MTPLQGRRVVVTRAAHQFNELADLLRQHGAQPIAYPAIRIAPPDDVPALQAALTRAAAGDFDWIVFSSANAVDQMADTLLTLSLTLPPAAQLAAIGGPTARHVQAVFGTKVQVLPETRGPLEIAAHGLNDQADVLLPQSALADDALASALRAAGARVTQVTAYQVAAGVGGDDVPRLAAAHAIDAITFTSGSTVDFFFRRFIAEGGSLADLQQTPVVTMGASTRRALAAYSLNAVAEARASTLPDLVSALEDALPCSTIS
jgi:uroporphyrinogen III methyltransferase/synthase